MMQFRALERSQPHASDVQALPDDVSRDIHQLAWNVATSCRRPADQHDVIVVIRRKPVNADGTTGCRAEIFATLRGPQDHLQLQHNLQHQQSSERCTTRVLNLERLMMGGWKITLDAQWAC